MRGQDGDNGNLFSYIAIEERIPKPHPLRLIREILKEVLVSMDNELSCLYRLGYGRPSIAPERLLRALILQALYTCLLYTSPSPRDKRQSRMPSSA